MQDFDSSSWSFCSLRLSLYHLLSHPLIFARREGESMVGLFRIPVINTQTKEIVQTTLATCNHLLVEIWRCNPVKNESNEKGSSIVQKWGKSFPSQLVKASSSSSSVTVQSPQVRLLLSYSFSFRLCQHTHLPCWLTRCKRDPEKRGMCVLPSLPQHLFIFGEWQNNKINKNRRREKQLISRHPRL